MVVATKRDKKRTVRLSTSDRVFYFCITGFLLFCFIIVLFPLLNVVSYSLSSPNAVAYKNIWLFPKDFTLFAYKAIIDDGQILLGFGNSIFYTVFGTCINIVLTIMAAYPLSRKTFYGRNFITFFFAFTMLFSGGMIPRYLLVQSLGMIDTRWALLLPQSIIVLNMILARTFFQNTIPDELYEMAELEGASDTRV
ncbi:carbohydrate ABC transporter permease, partial [bacterium]|nr:carbohydrate ABC transporter permease [bacterium]